MASTNSEDLIVVMVPVGERIITSITRTCNKQSSRIHARDIKCLCQDNPKIRLAIRRPTQLSSQHLDSLAQELIRKWYTKLKSPNLMKLEEPLLIRQLVHRKNQKVLARASSRCPCSPSSRTQFR